MSSPSDDDATIPANGGHGFDDETIASTGADAPTVGVQHGAMPSSGLKRIGSYKIHRELGAGGMGTVYLARDERMDRDVALKVMSRHQAPSEKAGKRFAQEAWIAGRLDHPNLVKVYERGDWQELSYFSMEVVDGGSLSDVIEKMRNSGRDDDLELDFGSSRYIHWALRKLIETAQGLDYAHRQGVVHRDIKPMNLLLGRELGAVKIADFGLALDADATRMTTAGTVMGTVSFMAPEQILGKQDQIDARTDVYALGVTLFEMLTLQLPYSGQTQQMYMSQVLTSEARRASKLNAQVSRDLEVVLRKAMEKDPKDRYQTAAALAEDLGNILHLRPIEARPSGRVKRLSKWVRRKPVHAALIALLAISLPTFGVVGARTLQERMVARQARVDELLAEAHWFEERQRYRSVLERVSSVLDLDPDNTMALGYRAMARFGLSVWSTDPVDIERLRQQALTDVDGVIVARPETSWPHTMKAHMFDVMERHDDAEAEMALAARYRAEVPTDEDLSQEAQIAKSRGEYDRAIELFDELIRRSPDRAMAIHSRAFTYEETENTEAAIIDYRVAVGLDPNNVLSRVDLARISADREHFEDAARYIEDAIELDGDNPIAHEVLGYTLIERGKSAAARSDLTEAASLFEQAEQASLRSLALDPGLSWAELNAANSLVERNRLLAEPDHELMARAIEHYRTILDRSTDPPSSGSERRVYFAALASSCDAQIQLKRLDEALAVCSRTTVLFPKNAVAFYNLAGVYALLGRVDEAIASLNRDLELGDTDWQYLASDRWFETLQDDPRFETILEAMKRRNPAS